ncbi:MAG: hypothetical protein AABW50_03030 [Nanoarchaeota archaeon]
MNCCGGHSGNHPENQHSHEEKKVSWFWIIMILLIIGLLVFSALG